MDTTMFYRHYLYTTVDITPTNVRIKNNQEDWALQRNQQRNYDTLIQTLSLRSQPTNIFVSKIFACPHTQPYGLGKNLPEVSSIWSMEFDIEHEGAFGQNCELVLKDLNYIPILNGLEETEPSFPPVFQTTGTFKNINIIFHP